MSGLRWVLLLLGLAFFGALAWWELRRPRQAGRQESPPGGRAEPSFEPRTLDIHEPAQSLRAAVRNTDGHRPLPVIEWQSATAADEAACSEASPDLDALRAAVPEPPGPMRPAPVASSAVTVTPLPSEPLALIVDWPPEGERQICNLRVVPRHQDRIPGRALRQGLQGCGFRHGEFGIFHMPGPDQRVVLSAANLARPGLLDPQNMDYQRFPGVNLFAVLPGPLSADETLQQLFDVARDLAERVDGNVLDDSGEVLGGPQMDRLRARILGSTDDAARGH